jgi:hypothetical protein
MITVNVRAREHIKHIANIFLLIIQRRKLSKAVLDFEIIFSLYNVSPRPGWCERLSINTTLEGNYRTKYTFSLHELAMH